MQGGFISSLLWRGGPPFEANIPCGTSKGSDTPGVVTGIHTTIPKSQIKGEIVRKNLMVIFVNRFYSTDKHWNKI